MQALILLSRQEKIKFHRKKIELAWAKEVAIRIIVQFA